MSFIDDVANVSITRAAVLPTRRGFGTPMLVAYHTLYNDRARTYSSLAAMASDGFRSHDPAYKDAAAVFSQNPRPRNLKVGRRALAPTQLVRVTPAGPTAAEVYTLEVDGLAVTCTADGTPTLAEICTALAAAATALADADAIVTAGVSGVAAVTYTGATLDGATGHRSMSAARHVTLVLSSHADWDATAAVLTGRDIDGNVISESLTIPNGGAVTVTSTKRYRQVTSLLVPIQSGAGGTFTLGVAAPMTADGTSGTHVDLTSAVVGEHHSLKVTTKSIASPAAANATLTDRTADAGLAADLAAIHAANSEWYACVVSDGLSSAEASAAAAYVETLRRVLVVQSADAAAVDSTSVDDVAYNLKAAGYARTSVWWYPGIGLADGRLAAGLLGRCLAADPGKITFAHKEIAGVTVPTLTDSQREALEGKNANYYIDIADDGGNTFPGKAADGWFFDVVRDLDWLHQDIQTAQVSVNRGSDKNPFTDGGIAKHEAALRGSLQRGVTAGVLASYAVTVPRAADVSSGDKAARNLTGVTFAGVIAGAINTTETTGTVSV